jgi:predicted phage terminase large subunit-like protein
MHYLTNGKFHYAKHLGLVERALHRINNGELKRLIVTMPPQHGKSHLSTIFFPLWMLGNNPDKKIMIVSYSVSLARKFLRTIRNNISQKGKQIFGIELDVATATELTLKNHSGYILGVGINGSITGKSADIMIIDDPIKNSAEANSATIRNKIKEAYDTTLSSRLQDGGAIIVIMTRWHSDDLVGSLLEETEEHWEHISLPAIAKENDLLGRKVGEPLWQSLQFYEKFKERIGSYNFSALFQQEPIANEYTIFNPLWWKYYDDNPHFDMVVQCWDTAFKTSEKNDYSVCCTAGFNKNGIYIIDIFRKKLIFPDLEKKVVDKYNEYQPSWVMIEDAGSGQSLIQTLAGLRTSFNIPIKPVKAENKEIRAHGVSSLVEQGKVYLKKDAYWINDFLNELAQFPQGTFDDQVDVFTMVLQFLKAIYLSSTTDFKMPKIQTNSKFTQGY